MLTLFRPSGEENRDLYGWPNKLIVSIASRRIGGSNYCLLYKIYCRGGNRLKIDCDFKFL